MKNAIQKTDETKVIIYKGKPVTLYRIKSLCKIGSKYDQDGIINANTVGGWIDDSTELSDDSWVGDNAIVIGSKIKSTRIMGNSFVAESKMKESRVYDYARIVSSDTQGEFGHYALIYGLDDIYEENPYFDEDPAYFTFHCHYGWEKTVVFKSQNDLWDLFSYLKYMKIERK